MAKDPKVDNTIFFDLIATIWKEDNIELRIPSWAAYKEIVSIIENHPIDDGEHLGHIIALCEADNLEKIQNAKQRGIEISMELGMEKMSAYIKAVMVMLEEVKKKLNSTISETQVGMEVAFQLRKQNT